MKLLGITGTELISKTVIIHEKNVPYTFDYETADFEGGAQITSYTYLGEGKNRPVLFVTNGGPGSSCCWTHLGLFGPLRIHLDNPLHPQIVAPFALENNPHCLLDICDLVLIDPPGTGFSDLPGPDTRKEFCSIDGDAQAIALFIESWTIKHGKTNSPLFFFGESYGTARAAVLCNALMGGPFTKEQRMVAINLNGVGLLGTAFSTEMYPNRSAIEGSVLNLSCQAAVCAYHHPDRFESPIAAAEAARTFAPELLRALYLGRNLSDAERCIVAEKLAHFSGFSKEELLAKNLRFSMDEFRNRIIPGKSVGAYDGRYVMDGPGNPGNVPAPGMIDPVAEDPAMGIYTPAFIAGMNLLREEFGLPSKMYKAINWELNFSWDYSASRSPLASLENAARRNPALKIYFAVGIYDLVTVPGLVDYILAQTSIPLERIDCCEYESGHMGYLGEGSAEQMEKDLRRFIGFSR